MGCIRAGKGPVLVLVHGFLSGMAYWSKQIESLSKNFEVIAMDLPGYGGETQQIGPDSIADFAANIFEKLDCIGVKNFHLIGHSMGGMIAQEMALQAPNRVNRLVLYGTGPIGKLPGRFEPLEDSMTKVQQNGMIEAKHYTVESWFKKGSADLNFASGLNLAEKVSLQTYINGLQAMSNWSAMGRLEQIQSQTLIIWGDRDRSYIWLQPYTLWQEIKNTNLAVMPDCSHNAHLENELLFNQIVFDFLTSR
ncbi:MAG: alpha/beta hydrolase [Marinomonas sp.]|uniref:alpha/beta fold hydrolase n=1 Tax=Marinomonas sp. TaxID=1904862 RepID=UPI003C786E59